VDLGFSTAIFFNVLSFSLSVKGKLIAKNWQPEVAIWRLNLSVWSPSDADVKNFLLDTLYMQEMDPGPARSQYCKSQQTMTLWVNLHYSKTMLAIRIVNCVVTQIDFIKVLTL